MAASKKACTSTIVPLPDGSGVTTRAGGKLCASFEGHTEVQFNQGALGAVLSGLVERLRQADGVSLAALFPDLYPEAAAAMRANRSHADEREIGRHLAPVLGAALVAYRVSPEEWASWYAQAVQGSRYMLPAQAGLCVSVGPALDGAQAMLPAGFPTDQMGAATSQATQFGSVLGAPGGASADVTVTSPYGALR